MADNYKFLALTNGTTGLVIPINDSKTAKDIFDALDMLGLPLNMLLTETKKETKQYLEDK